MTTYTNPPEKCDTCKADINHEFSDAYLPKHGCWGNVCHSCAISLHVSYGTGLGQRYTRGHDNKFRKVEG